jgi:hypothetical protein
MERIESTEQFEKAIEEQKENRELIEKVCSPYDPAELQEIAEQEGW